MYLSESLIILNTIDPAFCNPQATGKTLRKVYILNQVFSSQNIWPGRNRANR